MPKKYSSWLCKVILHLRIDRDVLKMWSTKFTLSINFDAVFFICIVWYSSRGTKVSKEPRNANDILEKDILTSINLLKLILFIISR